MAGSAAYTAVLDANVLYPRLLRDVLLSLAVADLYTAKWSERIEQEWVAARLANSAGSPQQVGRAAALMREAVPDCLITNYEPLVDGLCLPDPEDRHVLAAAIVGHADAIVTFNVKDFPREALQPFDIEVQTPDEFVLNQIMLYTPRALGALKRMRERWARPKMSGGELVDLLEKRQLAMTAAHLRDVADLI